MKTVSGQQSTVRQSVFIVFCLLFFILSCQAFAELTIKANHDHINVDFFYHGDEVMVSGTSDPDVDIIVKITSPESHQVFKKKGKMAGLLWMNVGTLNVENVPNLYFLHSTKRVEEILSAVETVREKIGYDALMRMAVVQPISDERDKERWFKEFVKFKEASRIYKVASGDVIINKRDNKQDYQLKIPWPYQASPGDYTVTVYAVKDKRVVEKAEAKVKVEQVGIVKTLAQMAKENGALYGIISITIAIAAGFGVGMIFRKGGTH